MVVAACPTAFSSSSPRSGLPSGAALTSQFWLQPAVKATAAVLLAAAADSTDEPGTRWLIGALVFSAAGDFLLAMPWWEPSFVLGLAAFLVARTLCFLAALLPLRRHRG